MTQRRRQRASVVGYWHAVEMFSPQQVPAVATGKQVYEAKADRPLPWEQGHPLQRVRLDPGYAWQHIVYGGVFTFKDVRDALLSVFGGDERDHDGRMDGQSALYALTINNEGRLLLDSPIFATCPWATGRALSLGPGFPAWLDGFDEVAAAWLKRCEELGEDLDTAGIDVMPDSGTQVPAPTDGTADGESGARAAEAAQPAGDGDPDLGSRRIAYADLASFTAELAEDWSVTQVLKPREIRVRSIAVREDKATDADQQDFLNSFIAADLRHIAAHLLSADAGPALAAYLTEAADVDQRQRIDLRTDPQAALDAVAPARTPAGRWPAEPAHPLALSQQAAVNLAQRELADRGGLFAVNGPPGTGKTTALRDHFAAIIVERACRLSELRLPSMAFNADKASWHTWKSAEYTRTVRPLIPSLTGFEMVVASANNGAVENISTEIPARTALGRLWREDADYFAEQATRLLKGAPAWGSVAARLGSKKNRMEFVNRFWHGKEKASDTRPEASPPGRPVRADPWVDTGRGLSHLLREWTDTPQTGVWRTARDAFVQAKARVEEMRRERDTAARAFTRVSASLDAVDTAHRHARAAADQVAQCHAWNTEAADQLTAAAQALRQAEQERAEHAARRPGFTVSLFTAGRAARDWYAVDKDLGDRVGSAAEEHEGWCRVANQAATQLRTASRDARSADEAVTSAEEALGTVAQVCTDAYARWGAHVPDPSWLRDETQRELAAPWADEELTRARSELFLAALGLHHAFVRCTARTIRQNLLAAMDVVTGAAPRSIAPAARTAAWQTLFLVVPIVSTTFASLDRVFTGLGPEALGWLFVDEAGQAAPQMAVGALWRAKRAVVVGDPLQLEPVVVLPFTAQQALRRDFRAAEDWLPARTSTQQLADQHNHYGTWLEAELPDGPGQVWVGAPLRVHRRCENPMFAISNAIAYDGLMVYGTHYPQDSPYPPRSSWVDVASTVCEGHWIPAEGLALVQILQKIASTPAMDLDRDVFVVSPFRDVVNGAKKATRGLIDPTRVGTVHTAQGKEADIVILVLGTDPKATGARRWAAQRPNLLNVAVSRAKRRLFVIGNHELWHEQRFYGTLAGQLPRHRWNNE